MLHPNNKFPKNLRLIREAMVLTQTELGKIIGASKTMIQSYESGKAFPKPLLLNKILAIAGFSISDLINKEIEVKDIKVNLTFTQTLLEYASLLDAKSSLEKASRAIDLSEDLYKDYLNAAKDAFKHSLEVFSNRFPDEKEEDLLKYNYFEIIQLWQKKQTPLRNTKQIASDIELAWNESKKYIIDQTIRLLPAGDYHLFEIKDNNMAPDIRKNSVVIGQILNKDSWYLAADFFIYVIVIASEIIVTRVFKLNDEEWLTKQDSVQNPTKINIADIEEIYLVKLIIKREEASPKMFDIIKLYSEQNPEQIKQ